MYRIPDNSIKVNMQELSKCSVLNENGEAVDVKTLWEKETALLIFLRHFACDACRRHAIEVWRHKEIYLEKGMALHFIGNGAPHFIKSFKEKYSLEGASFYTDPSLKSFKAAGFRKGFWIDPGEMHSRGEFIWLAVCYQIKMTNQGNVWQLGGVLAVKPDGKPVYQFTSQAMGDFPPADDANQL